MADAIRIDGLATFNRNLRKLDSDLPKVIRVALNEATDIIVGYAKPKVPRESGRAQASVKARSTRTKARVQGGGNRAPYYPWLDFGGRVGKNRSVRRAFLKEGRYIYAAYFDHGDEFGEALTRSLVDVVRQAGFEVD